MQRHRPEPGLSGGTDSGHGPERHLPVQERKAGETVRSNVGIDPDKDYLIDPQQRDAFTIRCDWCGHDIYSGEHFSRVPAPLWAREKTGNDEITFCSDCLNEIMDNVATLEVIRYGA